MMQDDDDAQLDAAGGDLDALCEAWVWWCREHRLYGTLMLDGGPLPGGSPRPLVRPAVAIEGAFLAAFHVAYQCQPRALDRQVFELHYVARVRPVKVAAAYLGIGHRQFYRVLDSFRRRLDASAKAFANGSAMPPATLAPFMQPEARASQPESTT